MKRLASVFFLVGLLPLIQSGCTGSGAVNPLTPSKASEPDASTAADSDVIYWSSFPVTFTLTDSLNGVCLVSKKLGWACGNNGVVLKYDGDTWSKVNTGGLASNENLNAVAFADDTEGWFVGTHGVLLHYLNGNWSLDSSPTEQTLYSIAVPRGKMAWVTGSAGTLLTYNGISWGQIAALSAPAGGAATTITQDIYGIGMSDPNNGWAVGSLGLILRYDGQKWETFPTSPTTERINSVSVINDVQAWAVGAFGTILRFNGTTWTKMGSAFSGFDLYQVCMKDDNDGWAVGQDGTLTYYDGSRWISHPKPEGKPSLNALAFYKDLGFAVGQNGTILKFQPNGEPAKYDFLFKGEVAKKPSKAGAFWTLDYTLMNRGSKTSPLLTYELALPKGFEPYVPKTTPTPVATLVMTPTPSPTATLAATPQGTVTPVAHASGRQAAPVSGTWAMKDGKLQWEIGTVASAEMKKLTILLQEKKGEKREYPALLKADLRFNDKVIAEAAPVTLTAPAAPSPAKSPAPKAVSGVPPAASPVPSPVTPAATAGGGDNPQKGGSADAQPSPTPGN